MKLPYMPWYPGDYLADTIHLSMLEDCLYRRLLDAIWLAGGSLPNIPEQLRRRTRCTEDEWNEAWPALSGLLTVTDELVTQNRLSREAEKAVAKYANAVRAGKRSAELRATRSTDVQRPLQRTLNERSTTVATDAQRPLQQDAQQPEPELEPEEAKKGVAVPASLAPLDGLLAKARSACASTRKSGKMAESVWQGTLARLEQFDVAAVHDGVTRYLDRAYCLDGKGERYMLGVVRGMVKEIARRESVHDDGIAANAAPTPTPTPTPEPEYATIPAGLTDQAGAHRQMVERFKATFADPQSYDTWARPCRALGMSGETIVILAPNATLADWVRRKAGGGMSIVVGQLRER